MWVQTGVSSRIWLCTTKLMYDCHILTLRVLLVMSSGDETPLCCLCRDVQYNLCIKFGLCYYTGPGMWSEDCRLPLTVRNKHLSAFCCLFNFYFWSVEGLTCPSSLAHQCKKGPEKVPLGYFAVRFTEPSQTRAWMLFPPPTGSDV